MCYHAYRCRYGQAPIHLAASAGNASCIEVLIAKGVDVNLRNRLALSCSCGVMAMMNIMMMMMMKNRLYI